jgi:hypothetical protein
MSTGEARARTRELTAWLALGGHDEHVEKVWTRTDRETPPGQAWGSIDTYRSVVVVAAKCCEYAYPMLRDELAKFPNVERVTEARRHDTVADYDALIVWWRWTS